MDILCLFETCLDSSVPTDDGNLKIYGYSSVRADHPSNPKRGAVLLYYKSCLLLKLIAVKYLHECINFELRIREEICKFLSLCRSPSQNSDDALNNDPIKINNWAYQWKLSFNPDPSKQAQQVIFCRKIKKPSHPVLLFNNNQVIPTPYQKHLVWS